MIQVLSIIISYGALLLLLIPASVVGIISGVVLFALGAGLMAYKRVYISTFLDNTFRKSTFREIRQYCYMILSCLISVFLGMSFHEKWIIMEKIEIIGSKLHLSREGLLFIFDAILSVLAVYTIYVGIRIIINQISRIYQKNRFTGDLVICLIFAVMTVIFSQFMIGAKVLNMGFLNLCGCVVVVLAVILLLYGLIGRVTPSIIIGPAIFLIVSTINLYIIRFRGRMFEPVDFFSAGTARNVFKNYSLFPLSPRMILCWITFIFLLVVFLCIPQKGKKDISSGLTIKLRGLLLGICTVSVFTIFFYSSTLKAYHWQLMGAQANGYILDFIVKCKEIYVPKPENYSVEKIEELANQYTADSNNKAAETSKPPHILVIMDEAFSDLSVLGEFSTNTEVAPFISSLKENTISGYTMVSVYGGNTANSEYEFLTGNSMAWLSENAVPYQQYVQSPIYSMVSYLKSAYDYKCITMHPYLANGWNRVNTYRNMGFDTNYFIDDFPQKDFIRLFISDQEMFEFLIKTYEEQKQDPLFVFGVTMQNHGDYTYVGENYTNEITLTGYENQFPEVEQYLTLIHETDKAVEQLIAYFQNVDEDVVIVFFGDHQPAVSDAFFATVSDSTEESLNDQQKRYKVPFFIWTNYDIEEENVECTSLNYLSTYVYNAAGIALPPYNQFLQEMEKEVPSINAKGYYSLAEKGFLSVDEANEEERGMLDLYESLQYNNLFDKKNRNSILFPVLEPANE